MMELLLDRMIQALGEAEARDEVPARWRLNRAGIMALKMDNRFFQEDYRQPFEKRPLFGIPISVIDDGSEEATFYLNTDSRG